MTNNIPRNNAVKNVIEARNLECQVFALANEVKHLPLMPFDVDITFTPTSAGNSGVFQGTLRAGEWKAEVNVPFNAQSGTETLAEGIYNLVYNFENGKIYITTGLAAQEIALYEINVSPSGTIKSVTNQSPYFPGDEFQALQEQVAQNTATIESHTISIGNIQTKNAQQDSRIATCESNIAKNTNDILEIKATVGAIDTDLQQAEAKIETNTADITALKNWQTEVDPTITAHTNSISAINDSISAINTKNTQQDGRISTNETNIAANTAGLTAANNRIDGIISGGAVTNYPQVGHITLSHMAYTQSSTESDAYVEDAEVKNVNSTILKIYNGDGTEATTDLNTTDTEGVFEIMPTINCIIEITYVCQSKATSKMPPKIWTGEGTNTVDFLWGYYQNAPVLSITQEMFDSTTANRYGFVCKERIYVPANQKVMCTLAANVSGGGSANLDQCTIDIVQAVTAL